MAPALHISQPVKALRPLGLFSFFALLLASCGSNEYGNPANECSPDYVSKVTAIKTETQAFEKEVATPPVTTFERLERQETRDALVERIRAMFYNNTSCRMPGESWSASAYTHLYDAYRFLGDWDRDA